MALSCQVTLRHMDPPILQEPFQHHQSRDTVLPEQGTLVTSSRHNFKTVLLEARRTKARPARTLDVIPATVPAAFLLPLLQVASQPSTGRRILLETGRTETRTR